ncbi:MAG: DNA mismatch repair endonuclease MutL [Verrucomicrobia bacterium]|nr:DNA mismatch repair endonuclease MutL [Verrucomicrobiota bacterium]MBI3871383.1 DNA mismatch repair endonuclease MutL [Verrucomicrobiota bacterium]
MNRIRLLSEQVANQIAAGEVVERPASVVKELVENSLDANASRVVVEIQAGGRSLIRVTDDGTGMSRDDALLSLEQHATSKIRKADDLSAIATLGFRGEAIPSIASVSRFVLTTRERDSDAVEATQVIVQGGKVVEVRAAGAPVGTTIEVRQIFFNVPARKKFLRTEETEFAHIQHYLTLAALAHPNVAFTLVKDSNPVWQLPSGVAASPGALPLPAVAERLRSLLGGEVALLPVDFSAELAEIPSGAFAKDPEAFQDLQSRRLRLWGFMGRPGVSRATRDQHFTFVNRRPVENRGLNFALLEGYHTALMKGRYPVCCLFLEIDPARVDVNIHPTKREVKFHNEGEIRRLVADGVRQTLLRFHKSQLPATPVAYPSSSPEASSVALSEAPSSHAPNARPDSTGAAHPPPAPAMSLARELPGFAPAQPLLTLASPAAAASPTPPPASASASAAPADEAGVFRSPTSTTAAQGATAPSPVFSLPSAPSATAAAPSPWAAGASPALLQGPLRILGVVGRLYVVLESQRGMVLMDQHAAHERILFEQMLQRLEQGQAASQRLLLPQTVELGPRDAQFLKDLIPTLTRLGVGVSEFGERTFLLDALPPFVKSTDARGFVLGLVDELRKAGQEVNTLRLGEDVVAKTVCRHAVKANDPLKGPELEALLADLRHCAMPYTCPHGRPTLIEMSYRELEKRFGRTT